MGDEILTRDDLEERAGVPAVELDLWAKAKVLKPVGFAENGQPFYAPDDLERALRLRKLRELGYGLEEIQKIVRKFGLPSAGGAGGKDAKEKNKYLTVGQLAERTGLSARTIKHWEEMGIIDPDMRSGGGFRLYSSGYVRLCTLIRDLQLFGYTLEEIKDVSGYVRDFLSLQAGLESSSREAAAAKLEVMLRAVDELRRKMSLLKEGIVRWEDLLKKKKKEITALKARNDKRSVTAGEGSDA